MPDARPTLVIYLPNLASGGAERLHVHLAPEFAQAGFDVTLLLHRKEGKLLPLVPENIHIVSMECGRTLKGFFPLIRFLRQAQPDVLIANLPHNNMLVLWARKLAQVPTRVITTFHSTLSAETGPKAKWQSRILPWLCRFFLGQSDGIVAVSKGVADDLAAIAELPRERISVIYNPATSAGFDQRMQQPVGHPWFQHGEPPVILGVGRLSKQKDFAMLLTALAMVNRVREARLLILGEGPLHDSLMALAESLGIKDRVELHGFVANPLPYMRHAAVMAMSSRYEGFGNVLVEALACGTPVVSTDCPYGPAEILEYGRFGKLVPVGDAQAMADAILATLEQPLPADMLEKRGREFSVENTAAGYIKLIKSLF